MRFRYLLFPLALAIAVPAQAKLPPPVRKMIKAAIATGDKAKVAAVVDVARTTNPDDVAEIDAMNDAFLKKQKKLAEKKKARKIREIREAGLFDRWSGQGEIGGYRNTGNTDNVGLTLSLSLKRKGIKWSHSLHARGDFQRSGGVTTQRQISASYEPNYHINRRIFAFGLVQYDDNRFQGFNARYSVSAGLGLKLIDEPNLGLSIKAGPAIRHTDFTDGSRETRLAGLAGLNFHWDITKRLKFTQSTNAVAETGSRALVVVDSNNTTLNLITGLDAKITDKLSWRISYQIEYESKPPPGAEKTDTLTRFSLVYGF